MDRPFRVVMPLGDPYEVGGYYFECRDCGGRYVTEEYRNRCPDCGGRMTNLAVPRE